MIKEGIIKSKWDKGTFEAKGKVDTETHQLIEFEVMDIPNKCKKLLKESIIIEALEYKLCDLEVYNGLTKKQKESAYYYVMEEEDE